MENSKIEKPFAEPANSRQRLPGPLVSYKTWKHYILVREIQFDGITDGPGYHTMDVFCILCILMKIGIQRVNNFVINIFSELTDAVYKINCFGSVAVINYKLQSRVECSLFIIMRYLISRNTLCRS